MEIQITTIMIFRFMLTRMATIKNQNDNSNNHKKQNPKLTTNTEEDVGKMEPSLTVRRTTTQSTTSGHQRQEISKCSK